jgi:DNA modification methylase
MKSLNTIPVDPTWSFADCKPSQTRYLTHSYHTYPAKFIPQLAARLIKELSCEGDSVCDPFMGSGTTVVEALVHGRRGVGVDINPVAHLIAQAKTTPIPPEKLERIFKHIEDDLTTTHSKQLRLLESKYELVLPENERIDFWFSRKQQHKLGALLGRINGVSDKASKNFFLVAFSQILKACSIWMQKSVKPVRDSDKKVAEPYEAFTRQAKSMLKRNTELYRLLGAAKMENLAYWRTTACTDARTLPLESEIASLIVTSPPYVTSYEYADLHQLTALWLGYSDSVTEFRKGFIGSAYTQRPTDGLASERAIAICEALGTGQKAREVRNYFADMRECFIEMKRVLKPGGKACIVVGNTALQGVDILNAEVFVEQMTHIGFDIQRIIKREIPSKILPQVRDPQSGRFTGANNQRIVHAYPVEYILVMEKQHDI